MKVVIARDKKEAGEKAADAGAELIRSALAEQGRANIILATGASQFELLARLVKAPLDWTKVIGFHLDEYVGLPETHPASFRRYLRERFVSRVPLAEFHYLNGETDPAAECRRVGEIIRRHPIDVAFVGIGENGHLAFNDPPADFKTEVPYLVVNLDQVCRGQQVGEGWFQSVDEVPKQAISMTIRQIMKSRAIICTVPELRKAKAVKACLEGPVGPMTPASILQEHDGAWIILDHESASLLADQTKKRLSD